MQKSIIGVEPTGHYWLNLAHFLKEKDIKLVVVNPMHVKKSKELDYNSPTKNDVKDAKIIAQLVKDGRYAEPNIPQGVYSSFWWQEKYAISYLLTFRRYRGKFTIG
jgi:transposase